MASVEKAKIINFQYNTFLWLNYNKIREAQIQGDFAGGLSLATTLIMYLPDDIKAKFRERVRQISQMLAKIERGDIPEIKRHTDIFIRNNKKQRILQTYGLLALSRFVNELSSTLEAKGYMERVEDVPEGFSHTFRRPQPKT